MVSETTPPAATPPKLLDQVRDKIRVKHYNIRTEQCYVDWIKRDIYLLDKRNSKGALKFNCTFRDHMIK